MATAELMPRVAAPEADQCVVFPGLDWAVYETLLGLRGGGPGPRMVFLDGSLFLVTTSFPHERLAERLGYFVIVVVEELDIPCVPSGSTTFRRQARQAGVEGDKTFYLSREASVRGKDEIDLRTDPPPDLAIEAVFSHAATAAVEVYRKLDVPEVWICDGAGLRILALGPEGAYAEVARSPAFPSLSGAEIFSWVSEPQNASETAWIRRLRVWVRETIVPRVGRPDR